MSCHSIPNVLHFTFGLDEQTEDFLFVYYLSVYSAYIINKPEKIYLYYHFESGGKWWERLKEIPGLELVKVSLPEYIGRHKITKTAHRADKLRMDVLFEYGGVYMDIDTISVRPYKDLLQHDTVLGLEELRHHTNLGPKSIARWGELPVIKGIGNAVMLTRPKSQFFKEWIGLYENVFHPNGWSEASVELPKHLAYKDYKEIERLASEIGGSGITPTKIKHLEDTFNTDNLTLLGSDCFFQPYCNKVKDIFVNEYNIPEQLITLHYWASFSYKYFKHITGWDWAEKNYHTLFGKIMSRIYSNEH